MKLTYIDAWETEDFRFRKVAGVMPESCHHSAWPKSFQGYYWLLINEQQHSGYGGQLNNDLFRREYAPYLNFKAVVGSVSAVVIFRACDLRL